jgi:hypothetical protein
MLVPLKIISVDSNMKHARQVSIDPSAIGNHYAASSRAHVDGQDNDKIIRSDGNRLNMQKQSHNFS